jgi:hypothetical protein
MVENRSLLLLAPLFVFVTACASSGGTQQAVGLRAGGESEQVQGRGGLLTNAATAQKGREDWEAPLEGDRAAKSIDDAKGSDDEPLFPAEDVRTALRAAAGGLRSCGDAQAHSFQAALRFEQSGRVAKVEVTPAAGPIAECIRGRLAQISVTPFGGGPVTVMMPVELSAL